MMNISDIKFNKRGLVPAIVQDEATGEVLTLAYMNHESLEITIREGFTCFYSRSREQLWRKGESSGNTQEVVSISTDCDSDALLVKVRPAGPACHTGANTCFYQPLHGSDFACGTGPLHGQGQEHFSLEGLYALLQDRKQNPKDGSYTNYLFEKGVNKILKKVGEEAAEVIIAAKNNDHHELTCELADLTYHALVLMVEQGLDPGDVRKVLAGRYAKNTGNGEDE